MAINHTKKGNIIFFSILGVAIVLLIGYFIYIIIFGSKEEEQTQLPVQTNVSTTTKSTTTPRVVENIPDTTIVATGLKVPWDIAFLPNNALLVTERPGTLTHIDAEGKKVSIALPRTVPKGEGGLLGLLLHPEFENNKRLYVYMTTSESSKGTTNAVFQYEFDGQKLTKEKTILANIPGALYHDGGRMAFGPDGMLYITTGDSQTPEIAQNKNSLGGKILRLNADGTIPSDNPFGTAVYSMGHRNPQGLAWDSEGKLWETEHGRSGIQSGLDELNLVEKGKNYGWPTIEGDAKKTGLQNPALHSGSRATWAPASLVFYKGSLLWAGLRGEAVYKVSVTGETVSGLTKYLENEYGRLRTIRVGPDGMFYLTTSNTDGRGSAKQGDDKIIKIHPRVFGFSE